uniref:Uncharacterized protein n=1 Tax=Panagrolaimus davidi TaxID=227884 RepID=A0A914QL92_9BILA
MVLQKQLEESFGNSTLNNAFLESSLALNTTKELSSAESINFSTSSVLMPVLPTTTESHGTLTNMVKEEPEEASNETANDDSDTVVVDMTDEIRALVF